MMSNEQIRYMVSRFLTWKLPADFNPDAGISFKAEYNEGTPHPMRHEPDGTNLFDATQAEAMVRHMVDGMPPNPTTQARDEVVAAAVAWGMAYDNALVSEARLRDELRAAVRNYQRANKPAGKEPEEVEPGTRFRFAPNMIRSEDRVFILMQEGAADGAPCPGFGYRSEDEGLGFFRFMPEDRIIPIDQE